jgi:hypothetical protein
MMERFFSLIIITIAIFGSCNAFADTSEVMLAREYFKTNNFIAASNYAEKAILDQKLDPAEFNDLSIIFVESKKKLGELNFATNFLHSQEKQFGIEKSQNFRSYLFDQNIYQNDFGRRLEKYNRLSKLDNLELSEIADVKNAKEITELDQAQPKKKPWLAATLSGIIPGAGQVYNGNYQSAAVAFVFNSLLLLSAIEFHHQNLDWPAVTAGTLFSMTYIGNIISSGRDAKTLNNSANINRNKELKSSLLPELSLSFRF